MLTDSRPAAPAASAAPALYWEDCLAADAAPPPAQPIDADVALLIYTSGSTGLPKGVVLSHRNLVAGAQSVVAYLGIDRDEVILGLLPLSFDAGFSQLSTALVAGARLVLHNYASARFVPALCAASRVSLITAIPPLWAQLAAAPWGEQARTVRTIANTGGHMPASLLRDLRAVFAQARPFLMYGLTEAFRSTYLDPAQIDRRPDSIGKAIPNAEILVLRPDGSRCDPGEHGELVHRGALVALGYWNDRAKTRERFRPLPRSLRRGVLPEYAVWSGDIVRADEDGFLYFVGRRDELMKISGYRVSPTEIEKALMRFGGIREAVVFGVDDEALGTAPVALLVPQDPTFDLAAALAHCKRELAGYMVPRLAVCAALAHSANGKIDRGGSRELYLRMQAQAADAAPVPA
nr:AMP-binding protein [Lysobacter enzymogenes]